MVAEVEVEIQQRMVDQARKYIALRKELLDRGEILRKLLDHDQVRGKTLVVQCGPDYFEVARSYGTDGLPLRITPTVVIGGD